MIITMCQGKSSRERKPNIRKEIDRRMAKALSRTHVTIEKVLLELETIRIKATNENRFSVAIRYLELQGRYLRMWADKIERPPTIRHTRTDELACPIRKVLRSKWLDLGKNFSENQ